MSRGQLGYRSNGGSSVWALGGLSDQAARDIERLCDRLTALTLQQWCVLGRACRRDGSATTARAASAATLAAVIDREQLGVTAWYVRDLVSTATYAVRHEAERGPRKVRRELSIALDAAETAALAIAAEEWLPDADAATLQAPFDAQTGSSALRLV